MKQSVGRIDEAELGVNHCGSYARRRAPVNDITRLVEESSEHALTEIYRTVLVETVVMHPECRLRAADFMSALRTWGRHSATRCVLQASSSAGDDQELRAESIRCIACVAALGCHHTSNPTCRWRCSQTVLW
jgi:hypothetical protein